MVAVVFKADSLRPGQTHGGLLVDAIFCGEGCLYLWLRDRGNREAQP